MRYAIMLQIVGIITIILLGAAGLFAWLQQRPTQTPKSAKNPVEVITKLSV